jgi:hypothetical protein
VIAPRGVRYVTINPPIALEGALPTEIKVIPIERFIEDY